MFQLSSCFSGSRPPAPRRSRFGFVISILAGIFWLPTLHAIAAPPSGYCLVWSEEFNGSALDPAKWYAWSGPNRHAINATTAVPFSDGHLTVTTYTSTGVHYSGI